MPTEEVVVDQDQEADQVQDAEEQLSDVVEGFEQEVEVEETSEEVVEEEVVEPDETESSIKDEMTELKAKIHGLNQALHKERQAKKEVKEEGNAESLTQEQIETLIAEHKDDPRTLYNIMNYIGKQAAKETSAEVFDSQKAITIKNQTESFMHKRFPELEDVESPAYKKVDEVKKQFNLADHPAGTYFAASAIIADNLDNLQKKWFEDGKKAALKEKVETTRKKNVKDSTLLASSKPTKKKSSGLSGTMKSTADQMGLTPSQRKIMESLIASKGD